MKKLLIFLSLLLPFFFAGCKDDDNNNDPQTKLKISLVDAPSQYDQINIEVLSVSINLNNEWIDYNLLEPGIYDLLELSNGNSLLLIRDQVIDTGYISELRLKLGENNTIVKDGIIYELKTPSGQSSGYKIKFQSTIEPGKVYEIIIDFDAARSIVETGSDKFLLKPVVHAYLVDAIGQITGYINPSNGGSYVMAHNLVDTSGTIIDSISGYFYFNVISGTYTVDITPNEGYLLKSINNVNVQSGEITDLGIIVIDTIPVK